MPSTQDNAACCKPFDPAPWQDKEHQWENKRFLKDAVLSFLHIPLNISGKITKNISLAEKAGALAEPPLMLMDEHSPWRSALLIEITKEIPGTEEVLISGTFLSKAFEGPYKNIPQWIREMEIFVTSRGKVVRQLYFFYTTCPTCAKKYNKNHVVLIARV